MSDRTTKVTLVAAVNGYIADMQRAATATSKVGTEAAEAAAKLEKQHQAMTQIGVGVAAVGAIAAVAFGIAVKKFAEFDQAMSNVQAATQESRANMDLLREAALEAGAATVFSATEAANAIEELGKAGLTTQQILGGGLKGALSLAAAGGLGVAEAASVAAIALKQFNLAGEDVPHVADLLAAGAGKAVGDVHDLSAALGQAGLVANGAGQSIEETTGTLAAFADAGLLGSDAGTSLKAALIALEAPTTKAANVMEKYHLSFFDANGQMLKFDEIAGQLKDNLSTLTDEQRNAALATIFGNDALRVANILYTQGADGIREYIDQTNDSGYAAKVAADRLNNLSGDVEKLGGAIDTALIRSGSGMNDLLRSLTQGATGIVDAIGSLPAPVLSLATGLTGVVAVVGLVGGAALLAVPKVAQFKLALSSLNISGASAAKGIGLATGALTLAAVAFGIWAQKQAEATATASEFQESLDQTTGAVTNYTRELISKKLAEASAFDGAKSAGISQKELTDAIIEGGDAVEVLRQKLYDYANGNPFDANIANSVNAVNSLSEGLDRADKNFDDQAAAAEESADKTTDAATAYQDAADTASELESNLRKLVDTINEANGVGQDAVSANAAYQSALAGISEEVEKQKAAYEELHGTVDGFKPTLDQSTEAGAENAAMLAGLAGKAQDAAEAQFDLDRTTMDAKSATEKYADTLAAQRKAFEDSAIAAGFNKDEVKKLGDQVFALPDSAQIEMLVETSRASTQIAQFIADANARTVRIGVTTYSKGEDGLEVRVGGVVARAAGGILPGAPSRSDNMLVHAASGEFVTNAASTAIPSNRAALEYINRGGVIRGYANGGMVQPQYASNSSRPVWGDTGGGKAINQTTNIYPQPGMSETQIGRAAAESTLFWIGSGE